MATLHGKQKTVEYWSHFNQIDINIISIYKKMSISIIYLTMKML